MVKYTYNLINIFMNIDESYRKLKKNRKHTNKVVSTENTHFKINKLDNMRINQHIIIELFLDFYLGTSLEV